MGAEFSFITSQKVASIRRELDHPVIDADGHLVECMPVVEEILADIADPSVASRWADASTRHIHKPGTVSSPPRSGPSFLPARVFYGLPTRNTLDRVTVSLPELMYRRMDEIGIDFALLYPTFGLNVFRQTDDEIRQALARALNTYYAEAYTGYRDKLEPVAVIPTHTPQEAVAELEYAVKELGLKAVVMSGVVPRQGRDGDETREWIDTLGHNSPYDYDPVWSACERLGVAPSFHGIGYGWGSRVSPSNYVYNHLGNFGAAQEAVCRSLVMGGIPQRFPAVKFSFLEGGATWACQLLVDLLGHYAKRNRSSIANYDPIHLNLDLIDELFDAFGRGRLALGPDDRRRMFPAMFSRIAETDPYSDDDFAESGIKDAEEIIRIFTEQFFFGCEADDPMNALAFDVDLLPGATGLSAMFASDIGHWDVPDMKKVLPEAWELVEHGHLDQSQFAQFACGNVARMLSSGRPDFFEGTSVADGIMSHTRRRPES